MGYELLVRPANTFAAEALVRALEDAAARGLEASLPPAPASPVAAAPDAAPLPDADGTAAATPAASESPRLESPGADPAAARTPVESAPLTPTTPNAEPAPTRWTLRNGNARLEARLHRDDAGIRGADLEVPFGGSEPELRRAFDFIQRVAEQCGAQIFDPQLGRTVSGKGADDVVARWKESQAWMMDVAGTYEDSRGLADIPPPPPLINRRNKILLTAAGIILVVYWVVGGIISAFTTE